MILSNKKSQLYEVVGFLKAILRDYESFEEKINKIKIKGGGLVVSWNIEPNLTEKGYIKQAWYTITGNRWITHITKETKNE